MNKKINLKTTRVLTIPRSFIENLEDLFYLVEENWDDCIAWDNFSELLRDLLSGEGYCDYLDTEINYMEDTSEEK